MSYRFSPVNNKLTVIAVTKEGETRGGIPKGVIIPIGYYHVPQHEAEITKAVSAIKKDTTLYEYVAKHCDKQYELTHIVPEGIVNRFGIFLTREDMSPFGNWCLDVGMGSWFRRKTVSSFDEIRKFL